MKKSLIVPLVAIIAGTPPAACGAAADVPPDPAAFVDQLEATFGRFEGYRRSGAKGVCAVGEFVGTAAARALSTASLFNGKPISAVVRFSVGGANPGAADNARTQRNMALQFDLPDGEQWQMGNISAPVFAAASPQQFLALLASRQPDPVTGKPDPARVSAFNAAHPEVQRQGRYFASQPVPASYGSVNYWGVHGYGFVDVAGTTRYGKWVFEPVGGVQGLPDEQVAAKGPDFLIDELRQRVRGGEVAFSFNLALAEPGDEIDNATVPLPEARRKLTLGTLRITAVSPDDAGPCLGITYDPMVMPTGVVPSADPLLPARAAPYAVSLGRRMAEGAKQR